MESALFFLATIILFGLNPIEEFVTLILFIGHHTYFFSVHIYDDLSDALLSVQFLSRCRCDWLTEILVDVLLILLQIVYYKALPWFELLHDSS